VTVHEAYAKYLAVSNHFRGRYDYFKYNGKVSVGEGSLERRSDYFKFEKLAKHRDPEGLLFCVLARRPTAWIGDVLDERSADDFGTFERFFASPTYVVSEDMKRVEGSFNEALTGIRPSLMVAVRRGRVSLETLAAVDSICGFSAKWVKSSDPVLSDVGARVAKYSKYVLNRVGRDKIVGALTKVYDRDGAKI
jgi:Gp59 loader of gp41 DNA helicase